ncbi:thioesterase family protein [Hoyosella sp. YIM 151337]|uniref:thioesterase family protein n=1 Tax=Hoyosella sp. YIM 151337 TaxID=2992742 RepID=UPI0022359179|nr:thioesterase family protein [Hoyosella sp. YIM 151337]MCW4354310.1 thioesterase family protein [Hoyosella sp. YIM 151337]
MRNEGASKNCYFLRLDDHRYRPTELTSGAWSTSEQHISPVIGLMVHAVERFLAQRAPDDLHIARISADILGVLPIEDFEISVDIVRAGRTIELLEATVVAGGRAAVRARFWRLSAQDTSTVAGGAEQAPATPEAMPSWRMADVWPGGFIGSLDVRAAAPPVPGRTTAWVTSDVPLVGNESASTLAQFIGFVDTANGISVRESPQEWMFPNLDLTIHLFRQPRGRWVGLETTVVFGASGHGTTTAGLFDVDGQVGYASQILTVRSLQPARV